MEQKTRLSHTALDTYQTCGKKYQYKYVDRWQEQYTGGSLVFGAAIDAGLNAILLKQSDGRAEFLAAMTDARLVDKIEHVPGNLKVKYAKADFDADLTTPEKAERYAILTKGWKRTLDEAKELSLIYWECLIQKGYLMLKAYKEQIMPDIQEVIEVQRRIKMKNAEGDEINGVIDMICRWKDGSVIVFDNKTSSMEYEEDAVQHSPQLTLYVHAVLGEYNTRKAGYIVIQKGIKKNRVKLCTKCNFDGSETRHKTCNNTIDGVRCNGEYKETITPEAKIKVLIEEIPEQIENIVLENFDHVNHAVKQGIFPRNLSSCIQPWGKCPYYDLCWKNDSSKLLKKS